MGAPSRADAPGTPAAHACAPRPAQPELLERLGNVNETCPPLQLRPGQLRTLKAKHFHLGASEAELRAWLAPHAHEPLLYFGRMFRRFHRFTSAEQHADFTRRFAWGARRRDQPSASRRSADPPSADPRSADARSALPQRLGWASVM